MSKFKFFEIGLLYNLKIVNYFVYKIPTKNKSFIIQLRGSTISEIFFRDKLGFEECFLKLVLKNKTNKN